jgi:hypothetical protein
VRGEGLLAVQMAERDVTKAVKGVRGHLPDAADRDVALGIAGRSPGHPAMGHDHPAAHAAGVRIGLDDADRVAEHPGVAPGGIAGKLAADRVGFEIGHAVDGHRSVRVLQQDRPGQFGDLGAQVHAGLIQQAGPEPEPAGGVVIAADQHDPGPGVVQPEQRVLAHLDRVHRGHGPVVDVPRDQHHVHLFRADRGNQMVEERGLRRAQIGPVQRPAQVPVGGVQHEHGPEHS